MLSSVTTIETSANHGTLWASHQAQAKVVITFVKQSSGFCAMAKMMVRWKKQNNSACPQCGCPEEDTSHVLKCPAPGTWEVWKKSMAYLRVWLTMQKTSSEIRDAIFAGLVWYNWVPNPSSVFGNSGLNRLEGILQQVSGKLAGLTCNSSIINWCSHGIQGGGG